MSDLTETEREEMSRIEREREAAREEGMAAVAGPVLALAEGEETHILFTAIRAAIPTDAAAALARVRAEAKAEERERLVRMFETEAAEAWGGDAPWLTTGRKVAELAACWIADSDSTYRAAAHEAGTEGERW